MVTPIDEAPDVSGAEATEYAENGTGSVATYTATDPEGTAIASWTLAGTDAAAFTIEGGVLRFAKSPDYENPSGRCGRTDGSTAAAVDNSYEITVRAMDSTGKIGEKAVTVDVTDVDEPGTVTLSARRPQVSVVFTASVADLDLDVGASDQPQVAVGQVQQQERLVHRHRRRRVTRLHADRCRGQERHQLLPAGDGELHRPRGLRQDGRDELGIHGAGEPEQQQRPQVRRRPGPRHG